jgi:hypothetical protein
MIKKVHVLLFSPFFSFSSIFKSIPNIIIWNINNQEYFECLKKRRMRRKEEKDRTNYHAVGGADFSYAPRKLVGSMNLLVVVWYVC